MVESVKSNSENGLWCELGVLFSSIYHLPGRAAPIINALYQHLPASTIYQASTTLPLYQASTR